MYNIAHINILIEFFGIFTSIAILLFLLTSGDRNSKLNKIFVRVMIYNIAAMTFAMIHWRFHGPDREFISRASVFLAIVFLNFLIPLLTDYIFTLIARNVQVSRVIPRVMYGLFFIWLASWVFSQFNDMYFVFDENNLFRPGEYVVLSQMLGILGMLIITFVIFWHRKSLDKNDFYYLLFFPIITVFAILMQIYIDAKHNVIMEAIYISNTFFALFCYGGIQARQSKLLKDKELELLNTSVSVMLSQIQPHFLYNSLVVIRQLCRINPKLAEETVVEFSNYLRGNLDSLAEKNLIPFEQELHHVETYLNIEKKRFGNKLKIVYDIKTKEFMIPVLTLQPIVENAVRYGITRKENGGTIEIKTEETESNYIITVIDDGEGFDAHNGLDKERSHIGIENTRSRLTSMCGGSLEIQSKPGEGTTAIIRIPK